MLTSPVPFFHAAPYAYRAPAEWTLNTNHDPVPAGQTLQDALTCVLDAFARDAHLASAQLLEGTATDGVSASVLLFPLSPGTVQVIGVSSLATRVRKLLTDDAGPAWSTLRRPTEETPIHALQDRMPPQMYNILIRNGFSSVEEAASIPEAGWQELRNVGPQFVTTLHTALADYPTPAELARQTSEDAATLPGCWAAITLAPTQRQWLNSLPGAPDEVSWHLGCELEPGHSGPHYAFGQTSEGHDEYWLRWDNPATTATEIVALAGCPVTSDEPPRPSCTLPEGHAGGHNIEHHWHPDPTTPAPAPDANGWHADYLEHRHAATEHLTTSADPAAVHASLAVAAAVTRVADLLEQRSPR